MKKLLPLFLILILASLISCAKPEEDDDDPVASTTTIPSFNISCIAADAAGCVVGTNGESVNIRILKGTCADVDSFYAESDASITCTGDSGGICSMTFTAEFKDDEGATVTTIPKTTAVISAFIDVDGDTIPSDGDSIYCELVTLSGSSAFLVGNSWSASASR